MQRDAVPEPRRRAGNRSRVAATVFRCRLSASSGSIRFDWRFLASCCLVLFLIGPTADTVAQPLDKNTGSYCAHVRQDLNAAA